jgi:hypothetical protein
VPPRKQQLAAAISIAVSISPHLDLGVAERPARPEHSSGGKCEVPNTEQSTG